VLDRVGLRTVSSQGYCFQVDLVFRVSRTGFRVREVPITFVERARGSSKMSGAVVREALWRVTSWGVRDRLRRVRSSGP
jgi:dolichol-phosphate mannosyltransferase